MSVETVALLHIFLFDSLMTKKVKRTTFIQNRNIFNNFLSI